MDLGAVLLLVLAVSAVAAPAQRADLFSRLDADGNGCLSEAELGGGAAAGMSWVGIDRNRDGCFTREEFKMIAGGRVTASVAVGGYSARRLIGAQIQDILVDPSGRVTGVITNAGRTSWQRAIAVAPTAGPGAAAGGTAPPRNAAPVSGEWRLSRILGSVVQLVPGRRFANVKDVILSPSGSASAIVVDSGPSGERGTYAYPWRAGAPGVTPPWPAHQLYPYDYRVNGVAPP